LKKQNDGAGCTYITMENAKLKTKLYLALVVALSLALILFSPAQAGKSYQAECFDVIIAVQPDGTLNITEIIVFRFTGWSFTYVFRELALKNLDQIDNLQASLDSQALAQGVQPGEVEITTGQPIKVTWHFAPAQDTVHEFKLTYRVKGAIRQDAAADTLFWRTIPAEHEYTINQGRIRIEYPAGVLPMTSPSLSGSGASVEAGSTGATFTLNRIDADTPVDITVSFPSQSLVAQPPSWQTEQQQAVQRTTMGLPFGLGAAAITTLLGVMWVIVARRSFRRETTISQNNAYQTITAPPRAIPPALAAKLTGSSVPFLGTLFDLARRGVLRIEEDPKKWGSRTFEVIRQPTSERLQPHEQVLLDDLFNKASNERVALNEISSMAYNGKFSQALNQELTTMGLRDAERSSRRGRFLTASILVLVLGLAAMGVGFFIAILLSESQPSAVIIGAILVGVSVAACGVGFIGLIVAMLISTLSDEGARQASAWSSFAGYLRNITRGREPVTSPDLFERYLPYAASLGLATEWAKFFQKQANMPIPAWFMSLQSGVEDGSFVAIMAAITAADSSASVATGSDGGGASGGGSSGAG
jgi:hypothetical protein